MGNAAVTLRRPRTLADWWRILRLYRHAFPANERKPFSLIRQLQKKDKVDVWLGQSNGTFCGLAITVNGKGLILLDYFAVEARLRGKGVGSAFLQQVLAHYDTTELFLEIELPDGSPEKERRLRFYKHNGLTDLHTTASLFGVPMMLLGKNCSPMDFARYHTFYRANLGEWAANHVLPLDKEGASN